MKTYIADKQAAASKAGPQLPLPMTFQMSPKILQMKAQKFNVPLRHLVVEKVALHTAVSEWTTSNWDRMTEITHMLILFALWKIT